MKAFGKILKSFSSVKRDKSDLLYLSDVQMENLIVCMDHIETLPFDQGLYRVSGVHEEVHDLEQYIANSTTRLAASDGMLHNIGNVHSITGAIKRILQTHAPIVHSGSYEKSTDAGGGTATSGSGIDLRFITDGLSAKELRFLVALCCHLEYIVHSNIRATNHNNEEHHDLQGNANAYYNLSVCIGTLVFRPHTASLSDLNHIQATAESKQRVGHFSQFLQEFGSLLRDEYHEVQRDRESKGLYSNSEGRATSANTPAASAHSATSHHPHTHSSKLHMDMHSHSSKPSYLSDHHFDNPQEKDEEDEERENEIPIVDRSVKLVFPQPIDYQLPSEEEIIENFSEFGHISQVGMKAKFAVMVFSSPYEAIDCHDTIYDSPSGTATIDFIEGYRVKFIGDMAMYYNIMQADGGHHHHHQHHEQQQHQEQQKGRDQGSGYAVGASPSPNPGEINLTTAFSEDSVTDSSTHGDGGNGNVRAGASMARSRIQDVSAINSSTTAVNHMDVTTASQLGSHLQSSPTPVKAKKPAMLARNSSLILEELGEGDDSMVSADDNLEPLEDSYEDRGVGKQQQQQLKTTTTTTSTSQRHRMGGNGADALEDSAASVMSGGLGGTGGLDGGIGVYDDSQLNHSRGGGGKYHSAEEEEFEPRENLLNSSGRHNFSFDNAGPSAAGANAATAGSEEGADGATVGTRVVGDSGDDGTESDEDFLNDSKFGATPVANVPLKPLRSNSQSFYDANVVLNKLSTPKAGAGAGSGAGSADNWKTATSKKSSDPYTSSKTLGADAIPANVKDTGFDSNSGSGSDTPPAAIDGSDRPPSVWSPEPQPLSTVTVSRGSSSKQVPSSGPTAARLLELESSGLRRQSVGEAAFEDDDDDDEDGASSGSGSDSEAGRAQGHRGHARQHERDSSSSSTYDSHDYGKRGGFNDSLTNNSVVILPTTSDGESGVDNHAGAASRHSSRAASPGGTGGGTGGSFSPNKARAMEVSKKLQKSRGGKGSRSVSPSTFRGQGLSQTQPVKMTAPGVGVQQKQFDTTGYRNFPPVPVANPMAGPNSGGNSGGNSGSGSYQNLTSQIENYREEIHRLQYYYSLAETSYNQEIVKLQCRLNDAEVAKVAQMEANRAIKLELSNKIAECTTLQKAKELVESEVEDVYEKAKRDAYSTVLSQTRLIGVLDSQRANLEVRCEQTQQKYDVLKEDYEQLASDCLEWKTTALAARQLLKEQGIHHATGVGGKTVSAGSADSSCEDPDSEARTEGGEQQCQQQQQRQELPRSPARARLEEESDDPATALRARANPGQTEILRHAVQESVERYLSTHGTGYAASSPSPSIFSSTAPLPASFGDFGTSLGDTGGSGSGSGSLSRTAPTSYGVPSAAAMAKASGSGSSSGSGSGSGSGNSGSGTSAVARDQRDQRTAAATYTTAPNYNGLGGTVGLNMSTQLLLQKLEQSRRELGSLGGKGANNSRGNGNGNGNGHVSSSSAVSGRKAPQQSSSPAPAPAPSAGNSMLNNSSMSNGGSGGRSANASNNTSLRGSLSSSRGVLSDKNTMSYYSDFSTDLAAVSSPSRYNATGTTGDSPGLRSKALQQWYKDNGANGSALRLRQQQQYA